MSVGVTDIAALVGVCAAVAAAGPRLQHAPIDKLSRETAHSNDAECPDTRRLELTLVNSRPTRLASPPIGLAPLDDSTFLAVSGGGGRLHRLFASAYTDTGDTTRYFGVASDSAGALAYSRDRIFRYVSEGDDSIPIDLPTEFASIRSVALSHDGQHMWVIEGPEDDRSIHHLRRSAGTPWHYDLVASTTQPGSWRLLVNPSGALFLFSTRRPFEIVRLEPDGQLAPLAELWRSMTTLPDSIQHIYVSSAVSLDCDAALVTLTDLHSDLRWLATINLKTGSLLSEVRIQSVIGIFGSNPSFRRLFGFRASEAGGEVVTYSWSWLDQPTPAWPRNVYP
jgi:hypothetical protein